MEIGGFSSQLCRITRGYPAQFGFVDPNFVWKKFEWLEWLVWLEEIWNDLIDLQVFSGKNMFFVQNRKGFILVLFLPLQLCHFFNTTACNNKNRTRKPGSSRNKPLRWSGFLDGWCQMCQACQIWGWFVWCIFSECSGEIIATSHEFSPQDGGLVRDYSLARWLGNLRSTPCPKHINNALKRR